MNFALEVRGNLFGVLRVQRRNYLIASFAQNRLDQLTQRFLVFDEQDSFRAALRPSRGWRERSFLDQFVHAWQVNLERAAFPRFAVNPDIAAALFHNAVYGRKAKTRAAAAFLGGEEGLKDVC